MQRSSSTTGRRPARLRTQERAPLAAALALAGLLAAACGADGKAGAGPGVDLDSLAALGRRATDRAAGWYGSTPPADRVTWGGLAAAAALGVGVALERTARLRKRAILPAEFRGRFLVRLQDGKLDRGKALDFCELNPSPASRVALAAVRRWGRPTADLERAASLAYRVEAERLRRNVGTLRRVAALTPLLGLVGTLSAVGRALESAGGGTAWGPALAAALHPLTAGVVVSVLALVAYDGISGRVEALAGELDRAGAETVDAIAMALPPEPRGPAHPAAPSPPAAAPANPGAARTPHSPPHAHPIRLEVPRPGPRPIDVDDFD